MVETGGSSGDSIVGQFLVAFGQGTGFHRVSRESVDTFVAAHRAILEKYPGVVTDWDTIGVQMLERARAVGRLAAHKALLRGDTVVRPEDYSDAFDTVASTSGTPNCK